jgi:hypothetical protein
MVTVFNLLLATFFVSMSHGFNFMPLQSKFRKCIACTVLVSSIGTGFLPTISIADQVEDLGPVTVTATKTIDVVNDAGDASRTEEARVKRKLALQQKEAPIVLSDDGEETYGNRLQREQAKQNARKKTKTERAKDLCESLGRGC